MQCSRAFDGISAGSETQTTGYDIGGTESVPERISGNSIRQNGGEPQAQSSQVAIEGLEEESAKAVQKQQDEVTAKENAEKYSTTQGGKQNQMFNTEQFKNGQQMLFDTSDMPKEPEVKRTTVTMKSGKEKEIEYVEEVPEGYTKLEGASTAPLGYTWYTNGKSLLNGERKNILVKDKTSEESSEVGNNEINIDARQIKSNETSKDFVKRILDTKIEKYKPTTYTIDWGSLRSQQQGKRSNGMVKGSMGDMTLQGEKEYKRILGGLPEYENIKNEFGNSVEGEQMKVAYLKAREAGFNQEESLDFAYTLFEPENLLYKKLKDNTPKENNPTSKEVKETGKAVEPKEAKKSEPKKREVSEKSEKYEDYGEKIHGARKDIWQSYNETY